MIRRQFSSLAFVLLTRVILPLVHQCVQGEYKCRLALCPRLDVVEDAHGLQKS